MFPFIWNTFPEHDEYRFLMSSQINFTGKLICKKNELLGPFLYFWAIHFFFRIFAPENSLFITNY
ncbi:hypothetical protein PYS58_11325 [Chryseobacterium indologenes]|uniref:hypothetical protein n=1 Tax=Chryseobacterium indologenes TaxID=253 RepID=UPI0023E8BB18|nr:hypothetical protein [Chryseobacterium indologenes]WET51712.1 hypothetical protein PYS58_11325 [Chryseobacterium indologenes]